MPNTTKAITNLYERFQSIIKIHNSYTVNKGQTSWVVTDFPIWRYIFLYLYLRISFFLFVDQVTEFKKGDKKKKKDHEHRKYRNFYNLEQATDSLRTSVYAPGHLWKVEEKKRCICCDSNTPLCFARGGSPTMVSLPTPDMQGQFCKRNQWGWKSKSLDVCMTQKAKLVSASSSTPIGVGLQRTKWMALSQPQCSQLLRSKSMNQVQDQFTAITYAEGL